MAGLKKYKPQRELLYLAPPLLVYLFACFLFELSVIDPAVFIIEKLAPAVKANATPDLPHLLTELKARYMWLASALLNIIIPVMSITIALSTIKLHLRRWQLAWTVIIGTILSLGNIGYLLYGGQVKNALYELIFGFTYQMLIRSEMFSNVFLLHVYIIILIINILASVTPIILLLAICATLRLPTVPCKLHPDYLAKRMRRLKEIINVGSAFLVFGILHMSMWLNWTASLVNNPVLSSKIAGVAWSISAYWGVAFTLVLVATYVPSTVYLQNQAVKQITRGKTAMAPKEAEQWLNEHGFSFTLSNQLTQCISIMAPILAAPISSILKSV
ncbi:MAG: hypothetical protein M1438_15900 [Deltaproteobacteria bacterium]|nr:hypothetical protein [Deltaproteobacteria bacterium]